MSISDLKKIYMSKKKDIEERLKEFREIFDNADDERIFAEFVFCLLTPQSKAKTCWKAVENLMKKDLILHGGYEEILKELKGVRFRERKAKYIIESRKKFLKDGRMMLKQLIKNFPDPKSAREWFVRNIKGMGYKEASHFLRNIGLGEDFAILDRHILKNLKILGVIEEIPKSLTRKKYMEIENKMKNFSEEINIPLSHLDLLFWSKETGEVFK